MKVYASAFAVFVASLVLGAEPAAAQSCSARCNTANMQCSNSGKSETACLNAWHQCKQSCNAAAAAPAKVTTVKTVASTRVIKASTATH